MENVPQQIDAGEGRGVNNTTEETGLQQGDAGILSMPVGARLRDSEKEYENWNEKDEAELPQSRRDNRCAVPQVFASMAHLN